MGDVKFLPSTKRTNVSYAMDLYIISGGGGGGGSS